MSGIFCTFTWMIVLGTLAYHKTSKYITAITLICGFLLTVVFAPSQWVFILLLMVIIPSILLLIYFPKQRKYLVTQYVFKLFQSNLPKISETERIALEAGTVWWDGELFSGKPNWQALFKIPTPKLTEAEEAFLKGPVETLCKMIDDWDICYVHQDLTPELWQYLKEQRFFALIIPQEYGGLEFSAFAHSEILAKIASKSLTVASIVAVPNSLGPAELILKYGTPVQKNYYLPRLATGQEIPCFALTGPDAGSDAAAIPDSGVICHGEFKGSEILGIRLNWDKRYTTLAPIATLLGLAFKLYDPDHLIGDKTEIGITCALIPVDLKGIIVGQRHKPLNAAFPNGPTRGKNVFIPLDWIIGGIPMAGQGWRMLIECLSAGRAISLPSSVAGATKALAGATGAYARIRRQFRQPIGRFEGIEEVLARMAGNAYLSDAARTMTAASIDRKEASSVLGAIIKCHLTERGRQTSIDAMDIHGGKGIMLGPKNYVALIYQNVPICITVEGANILTRSMIIFGQGAMRAHPYLLQELQATKIENPAQALDQFDDVFSKHVLYTISNAARAFWMGVTQIRWYRDYTRTINRASSAFAFIADVCLLLYGGKIKFKEKISGRLGDCLSLMYLASCALKRYEEEGRQIEDNGLLDWLMRDLLSIFWVKIDEILSNMPKVFGFLLKVIVMPLGKRVYKPSDELGHGVAQLLLSHNATRDRLLRGIYLNPDPNNQIGLLEVALTIVLAAEAENATTMVKDEAEKLRREVIAVDYFLDFGK